MQGRSGGVGQDYSANPIANPPSAFPLKTIPPDYSRNGYLIQNNDAAEYCWVVFDNFLDGTTTGTGTVFALAPAPVANGQGGSLTYQSMPHAGRMRIYGTSAATKVGARTW